MASALVNSDNSSTTSGRRDRQCRKTGTKSQVVIVSTQEMRKRPAPPAHPFADLYRLPGSV
jgi:hypothetical protein